MVNDTSLDTLFSYMKEFDIDCLCFKVSAILMSYVRMICSGLIQDPFGVEYTVLRLGGALGHHKLNIRS